MEHSSTAGLGLAYEIGTEYMWEEKVWLHFEEQHVVAVAYTSLFSIQGVLCCCEGLSEESASLSERSRIVISFTQLPFSLVAGVRFGGVAGL